MGDIKIYGKLSAATTDKVLATTEQIKDEVLDKTQQEINYEVNQFMENSSSSPSIDLSNFPDSVITDAKIAHNFSDVSISLSNAAKSEDGYTKQEDIKITIPVATQNKPGLLEANDKIRLINLANDTYQPILWIDGAEEGFEEYVLDNIRTKELVVVLSNDRKTGVVTFRRASGETEFPPIHEATSEELDFFIKYHSNKFVTSIDGGIVLASNTIIVVDTIIRPNAKKEKVPPMLFNAIGMPNEDNASTVARIVKATDLPDEVLDLTSFPQYILTGQDGTTTIDDTGYHYEFSTAQKGEDGYTVSTPLNLSIPYASNEQGGLITAEDKTKLNGIQNSDIETLVNTKYVISSLPPYMLGDSMAADSMMYFGAEADKVYVNYTAYAKLENGIYSEQGGVQKYLPTVTTTTAGVMSAADKVKLDSAITGTTTATIRNTTSSGTPLTLDKIGDNAKLDVIIYDGTRDVIPTSYSIVTEKGLAKAIADVRAEIPTIPDIPEGVTELDRAKLNSLPPKFLGATDVVYDANRVSINTSQYSWNEDQQKYLAPITLPAYINGATTTKAGVMTAQDKANLDGANEICENLPDELISYIGMPMADENAVIIPYKYHATSLPGTTDNQISIPAASTESAGLMTSSDKQKLDSLSNGVSLDDLPEYIITGQDGEGVITDAGYNFGFSMEYKGTNGYSSVPPLDITIPYATTAGGGLMSKADKAKLDGLGGSGRVPNIITLGFANDFYFFTYEEGGTLTLNLMVDTNIPIAADSYQFVVRMFPVNGTPPIIEFGTEVPIQSLGTAIHECSCSYYAFEPILKVGANMFMVQLCYELGDSKRICSNMIPIYIVKNE